MSEASHYQLSPANAQRAMRLRIESLTYLPTSVGVALKLMELGHNTEADPSEYARVISGDPGLYAKLLSLSNSSFFGVSTRVTKPQMAVSLLGLSTVRTLAMAYCLAGIHNELQLSPADSRPFWAGSLLKAVAAKQFASVINQSCTEEAFAAGLLQDLAVPIMFSVNRDYVGALYENNELGAPQRLERETAKFNMNHAEWGRLLAQKLNLPPLFVNTVGDHHNYALLQKHVEPPALAQATYVAALFPRKLDRWNSPDACDLREFLATSVPALDCVAFVQSIEIEFRRLYAYFHEGYAPAVRILELMTEATRESANSTTRLVGTVQELMRDVASAGKQMNEVIQQEAELQNAAMTDQLTGALNRAGFRQQAYEMMNIAVRLNHPYAIMFLDLDHFKQLNDQAGHAAGDLALQQVVKTMHKSLRSTDCIARVGGDEFVVLMSNCDHQTSVMLAERLIKNIQISHIGTDQVAIAASGGLVTVQPNDQRYNLEEILQTADKLMYMAKHEGGGRFSLTRLIGQRDETLQSKKRL